MIVVGEMNPYGVDPRFALYHMPEHAAGGRLREILQLSVRAYVGLTKVNLCVGSWSLRQARESVDSVITRATAERHVTILLLGKKVAEAFCVDLDFLETKELVPKFRQLDLMASGGIQTQDVGETPGLRLAMIPHPSGLNRLWNDHTMAPRVRKFVRELEPTLPIGGDS